MESLFPGCHRKGEAVILTTAYSSYSLNSRYIDGKIHLCVKL